MAAPQPFNERFSEEKYSGGIPLKSATPTVTNVEHYPAQRTLHQASLVTRNTKRALNTSRRAAGTTLQVSGLALQAAGKSVKVAGDSTSKVGQGLSRTGVGAIVGAPMIVGGRIAKMAGSATDTAGKAARRAGSRVKGRGGSASQVIDSAASLRLAVSCLSWIGWLWVMVQIPFAILTILFFGLTYSFFVLSNSYFLSLQEKFGGDAAKALTEWTVGFFGPAAIAFAEALFYIFWLLTLTVGLVQLFAVMMIYGTSLFRPLNGHGAIIKYLAVIAAIVGYIVPILNLFPWVFLYLLVLIRYPK